MTPILRNRHEKVQEASINLIGRIADRGAEFVSAREWMRICFELLDLLKAHKRAIRRAAVNSFGYIAKAIGPQDVLSVLLTNLKVQDRQSRVCSTVAIGMLPPIRLPYRFVLTRVGLQLSSLKPVDLSPASLPSSTNTEHRNSTYETVVSKPCRSCSSTSGRWVKITSTRSSPVSKTLSPIEIKFIVKPPLQSSNISHSVLLVSEPKTPIST